jgi:hypothetical protein
LGDRLFLFGQRVPKIEKRKPANVDREIRPQAVIAAPDGLTPKLKTKSRARRERQRALAEIAEHTPKRRNDLLPKLAVSYVPIDELRQAPRRVRRAHAEQVARIRASIEKFGVCQPVLIAKDRTIVHGHGVVEAARAAGLTEIPVIFVEHFSPAEQRLLSITLNRTGETGQWDEEALRIEFAELIDLGENVVVSGFEAAEIDFLCSMMSRTTTTANSIRLSLRQEGPSRGRATSGSWAATAFCRPTRATRRATNAWCCRANRRASC